MADTPDVSWGGKERRRFSRVQFHCNLYISYSTNAVSAETINIGPGGIRVRLGSEFKTGTPVKMEIFCEPNHTIKCNGYVIWVSQQTDINTQTVKFDTGIQFDNIISEERQYIYSLIEKINKEQDNKD
jgi:hypothetical protein